jgi:diadenosine tetraphosphate (Ap4A) HIT family hydrolase
MPEPAAGSAAPETECPFCDFKHFRVIHGNDLAVALRDEYPVSKGHTLILPRRHVCSWFDATENERSAMLELIDRVRERIEATEPRPDGYNIGINDGEAAGQTIMHLHVHLIPRYRGDVEDPRGGVRHVIPGRGNYLSSSPEDPSDE